jgi:hypothetical protein
VACGEAAEVGISLMTTVFAAIRGKLQRPYACKTVRSNSVFRKAIAWLSFDDVAMLAGTIATSVPASPRYLVAFKTNAIARLHSIPRAVNFVPPRHENGGLSRMTGADPSELKIGAWARESSFKKSH